MMSAKRAQEHHKSVMRVQRGAKRCKESVRLFVKWREYNEQT